VQQQTDGHLPNHPSAPVEIAVDPRTELMSILWRLAGVRREYAQNRIAHAAREGFPWIAGLAELLADYEANRARYPNFESFTPRLVEWFRQQAGCPERE